MSSNIGRFIRVTVRICALLATAAIITAVSHVNMAVAGIGGIGGGGKGGGGRSHASLEQPKAGAAGHLAALSLVQLQDAIRKGTSEGEIRALANDAGYLVVIT